jgi:hypothetical protein
MGNYANYWRANMINEYRIDQMTNEQLRRYYDQRPNLTLKVLSALTGKTVKQLKAILMVPA